MEMETKRKKNKIKINLLDIQSFSFTEKEDMQLIAMKEIKKFERFLDRDCLMIEELHMKDYKLQGRLLKMQERFRNKYWDIRADSNLLSSK